MNYEDCIYPMRNCARRSNFNDTDLGPYQFPDGQNIDDLPKLPPEKSFWHYRFQKYNSGKYSKEMISRYIDKKIVKIEDYFRRLKINQLTTKELERKNTENFFGPYFPTPKEIQILRSLVIEIDWDLPKCQEKMEIGRAKRSLKTIETEYLIVRWKKFQKKYNIYDLRPLLGIRCGFHNASKGFTFFRMVSPENFLNFLRWMGKGLPTRTLVAILYKLNTLVDKYFEGQFHPNIHKKFSEREVKCIEEIYYRYNSNTTPIMELVIGKRSKYNYEIYFRNFLSIQHIPIKFGSWTKSEDLEIINFVCEGLKVKHFDDLLTKKFSRKYIRMRDLFNTMKSRTTRMLTDRWNHLKRNLAAGSKLKNTHLENRELIRWSHDDTIRLICKVYETKAESLREVEWITIVKYFPGFCDMDIKEKFAFLYRTRIPVAKQKYFDESVEFLYHNVVPMFKLKHLRQMKRKVKFSYALDLCDCIDEAHGLVKYFEEVEIEDYDEDCKILSELFHESPYYEELTQSCHNIKVADINFNRTKGQRSLDTIRIPMKESIEPVLKNGDKLVKDSSALSNSAMAVYLQRNKNEKTLLMETKEVNTVKKFNEHMNNSYMQPPMVDYLPNKYQKRHRSEVEEYGIECLDQLDKCGTNSQFKKLKVLPS